MSATRFKIEHYEDDSVAELHLDGEELEARDEGVFYVEVERVEGLLLSEIPDGIALEPILEQENDLIHIDVPMRIYPYRRGSAVVQLEVGQRRKYWDEKAGLGAYVEAYLRSLELLRDSGYDIAPADKQDDGDYVFIHWEVSIKDDALISDAIAYAKGLWEEAAAVTDQILYGYRPDPKEVNDEESYTKKVLIPLLVGMGFQDVKYKHGDQEFGKDVTFSRMDGFGVLRHFGAQVKFGNVSGGAVSLVDTVIGQIEDAFAMPYVSLTSKEERYVSGFFVIASGKFTSNAELKILTKLSQPAIRTNVTFLDGDKVAELVEQYSRAAQST